MALPAETWRDVTWREGTKGELTSRFTAAHIRPRTVTIASSAFGADGFQPLRGTHDAMASAA